MQSCPFCGSRPYVGKHKYYKGKFIIRCGSDGDNCSFFPSSGPIDAKDLTAYVKEWNIQCLHSK